MLIVCPNCATSYRIATESLGETGRTVRCKHCHEVWFEQPQPERSWAASGTETLDPASIRPPLNDVIDIAESDAGIVTAGDMQTDASRAEPAFSPDDPPSIVPPLDPAAGHAHADAPESIEQAAARRFRMSPGARRRLPVSKYTLPASICALVLIVACLFAARQQIVRFLPQTASLYASLGLPVNLRGLAFQNIKTAREVEDNVPMLVVEGDIVGTTGRHTEVPRLRFAVVDGQGKEIYAWTTRPARTLLPPGETLPFRSRLASPPAEASGISVRFFNRHDAQAGFM